MISPGSGSAESRGKKPRTKALRKFHALETVASNPQAKHRFRGPDPGPKPPQDFPCQSWRFPDGRGDLGSPELQVGLACHAASRAWARAEAQGQGAVDQLCDTTVTLAIADKAIEL